MRKFLLAVFLIAIMVFLGCSQQGALDRIIQDPDARSHMIGRMMAYEDTRAEIADSVYADQRLLNARIGALCQNERSREMLLQQILAADPTGEWTVGKLAENPDVKQAMREAAKR